MLPLLFSALLALSYAHIAAAAGTYAPFRPHAIPLLNRSPYVNLWILSGDGRSGALNEGDWPTYFQGGNRPLCGNIRIDGTTYTWMGQQGECRGDRRAEQTHTEITATSTIFSFKAGPMDLKVTFLNPITPNDYERQSLPYAYITLEFTSNDGQSHNVQAYSDMDARFLSNDPKNIRRIKWSTSTEEGLVIHKAEYIDKEDYGEDNYDLSLYGTWVYATNAEGVRYQTGPNSAIRDHFHSTGSLANSQDGAHRSAHDNTTAFGLSKDFGNTRSSQMIFVIGQYRDKVHKWEASDNHGQVDRPPVYFSKWPSLVSSLSFFASDYSNAVNTAETYNHDLQNKATEAVSDTYAQLVIFAARQFWTGAELSISRRTDGSLDTEDIFLLIKEVSTADYMQTVDVLFPAFPYLIHENAELLKFALEPVLLFAESGKWGDRQWAPHDLGYKYPKAVGMPYWDKENKLRGQADAPYYLEESGNMLTMMLAYTQKSNNLDFARRHRDTLRKWAKYMSENGADPIHQASTDDFLGESAHQTNLAIKAAAGVQSYAVLARMLGDMNEFNEFSGKARHLVNSILAHGSEADGHLVSSYDQHDVWVQSYNLYMDKALDLGLFPDSTYNAQALLYRNVSGNYDHPLPLRGNNDNAKADWLMFTSATHPETRDLLIDHLYKYMSNVKTFFPLPDRYFVSNGLTSGFADRPVVGAFFAHLASKDLADARNQNHQKRQVHRALRTRVEMV